MKKNLAWILPGRNQLEEAFYKSRKMHQSVMNRRSRSLREFKRMSLMHRFWFQTTMRRMRKKLGSPEGYEIQDNRLRQ